MNDISKLQEELLSLRPNSKEYIEKSKLLSKLQSQSYHIKEIERINKDLAQAKSCLSDLLLCELAQEEINYLQIELKKHKYELNKLLSTHAHKNVILEIRAGAGGSEAALFAHDLHNMYMKYAELHKWKYEIANCYYTDLEGIKEIRVFISGEDAFTLLRHESGVHRVQRIPKTESSGRIHTSTATVAVLPEIEVSEIEINPNDIRIDTYRSSGPGGQSVNTTDSAVRIVHIPTNIVVQQQDEKSQYKNKEKAMKILRATLYEYNRQQQHDKESSDRKAQVGTGDRSERIRTYNFPQRRVTDHRINKSVYNIENILNGQELDKFIEELILLDC